MLRSRLQNLFVAYAQTSANAVVSSDANKQLEVYQSKLVNNTAGAIAVGMCKSVNSGNFDYYTVTDASSPKAALANDVKSGGSVKIFTDTANDGFLLQSNERVNLIGVVNDTTSAAIGAITVKYYNGSAYTTVTATVAPTGFATAAYRFFFLNIPYDWVPGTTTAVGGSGSKYSLLVTMGAGATNAVTINSILVGSLLDYNPSVASKASHAVDFYGIMHKPLTLNAGEGLIPYFGTADSGNSVRVLFEKPSN